MVGEALGEQGVEVDEVRIADHEVPPGVESDLGEGDQWPGIRQRILDSEILAFASPTSSGMTAVDGLVDDLEAISADLGRGAR